ncbi:MAG TPA: hypothetical protein VG407_06145 [Caulobacteraceae bacterium]|nr:hypothetical protein [Caulobacteraceae bacterium]
MLADDGEAQPQAAAPVDGDPLTLDVRPYAPRPAHKPASKLKIQRPGRIAAAVVVTAAVGGAVAVGVVNAMHAQVHHLPTAAETSLAAARQAAAVAANPAVATVEARPFTEYQPPDREQVSSAFAKVGAVYRSEGLSGVVRQSMDCFAGLKSAPSYATLDFCIAADAYGEALQRKLTDGAPPAGSYFTDAASRELTAARAVIGADGDPGARVLDIHRLAGEVSQAAPSAVHMQVAANAATPLPAAVSPHEAPVEAPVEAPPPSKALGKAVHAVAMPKVRAAPVFQPVAPTVRVTHRTPAPHVVMLSPRLMKARAEPVSRRSPHPRLETVSARVHAAPPRLVKARVHITPPEEHPHLTRVAARAKFQHVRERFAEDHFARRDDHAAPHRAPHQQFAALTRSRSHHVERDDGDGAPPWQGAIRAIRASLSGRSEAAGRRSAEPAEWVDCRSPRSSAEVRMCEGGAAGDGTLQGQVRGRNR